MVSRRAGGELRRLRAAGAGALTIARMLGRKLKSVESKLVKLRLEPGRRVQFGPFADRRRRNKRPISTLGVIDHMAEFMAYGDVLLCYR